MKTIKSFEDACKVKGYDPKALPDFSMLPEEQREAMTAHFKLVVIAQALNFVENNNQDWIPDWTNYDEYKYFPWFEMGSSSGSGFAYDDCARWNAHSTVGSRLCFKSRELAEYAGKQFEDLYKTYFTI